MSDFLSLYSFVYAVTCLAAYLGGAIPFGWIAVKLRTGKDVRTMGSGNIGATNVARSIGLFWFVPVFALDFLKGFAPVFWLAPWVAATWKCPACPHPEVALMAACAFSAMAGHMWPVWLRFRGGKGVATVGGVLFALNWQAALVGMGVWTLFLLAFRYVSLASVAAAAAVPVAHHLTYRTLVPAERWILTGFLALAGAIVIVRHRSNLARIRKGSETKVWKKP